MIYLLPRAATLMLAAGLLAAAPSAADPIDPAAYPELTTEALLPLILADLKHTLPDIYSVREMRLCAARRIRIKDGKPDEWGSRMEFNTKNEAGGYTGIRRYTVVFKHGRVGQSIMPDGFTDRTGLGGIFNKMIDKQMAVCPSVPDAVIQKTLAAGTN